MANRKRLTQTARKGKQGERMKTYVREDKNGDMIGFVCAVCATDEEIARGCWPCAHGTCDECGESLCGCEPEECEANQ